MQYSYTHVPVNACRVCVCVCVYMSRSVVTPLPPFNSPSVHQQHVPVDAVLFLQARMTGAARLKGTAVLVTSEAGHAHFWDIFGSSEPMGGWVGGSTSGKQWPI